MKNPGLQPLFGGLEKSTVSDQTAQRSGGRKFVEQRRAEPVFQSLVEVGPEAWVVHEELAASVDKILARQPPSTSRVQAPCCPLPMEQRSGSGGPPCSRSLKTVFAGIAPCRQRGFFNLKTTTEKRFEYTAEEPASVGQRMAELGRPRLPRLPAAASPRRTSKQGDQDGSAKSQAHHPCSQSVHETQPYFKSEPPVLSGKPCHTVDLQTSRQAEPTAFASTAAWTGATTPGVRNLASVCVCVCVCVDLEVASVIPKT